WFWLPAFPVRYARSRSFFAAFFRCSFASVPVSIGTKVKPARSGSDFIICRTKSNLKRSRVSPKHLRSQICTLKRYINGKHKKGCELHLPSKDPFIPPKRDFLYRNNSQVRVRSDNI